MLAPTRPCTLSARSHPTHSAAEPPRPCKNTRVRPVTDPSLGARAHSRGATRATARRVCRRFPPRGGGGMFRHGATDAALTVKGRRALTSTNSLLPATGEHNPSQPGIFCCSTGAQRREPPSRVRRGAWGRLRGDVWSAPRLPSSAQRNPTHKSWLRAGMPPRRERDRAGGPGHTTRPKRGPPTHPRDSVSCGSPTVSQGASVGSPKPRLVVGAGDHPTAWARGKSRAVYECVATSARHPPLLRCDFRRGEVRRRSRWPLAR
jgi:hypothetical protein